MKWHAGVAVSAETPQRGNRVAVRRWQEESIRIVPADVRAGHRRPIGIRGFAPVVFHEDEENGWKRLARAADRDSFNPDDRDDGVGFRLSRSSPNAL